MSDFTQHIESLMDAKTQLSRGDTDCKRLAKQILIATIALNEIYNTQETTIKKLKQIPYSQDNQAA